MALNDYFTGLQHVGIPADDLNKTVDFYKSLGFEEAGSFPNGDIRCVFMKYGNLIVETWSGEKVANQNGAINHISMNTTDVDKAFEAAKNQGFDVLDDQIQSIPSYWDNGIRFFNILGPNHEKIEFCQIL